MAGHTVQAGVILDPWSSPGSWEGVSDQQTPPALSQGPNLALGFWGLGSLRLQSFKLGWEGELEPTSPERTCITLREGQSLAKPMGPRGEQAISERSVHPAYMEQSMQIAPSFF